MRRERKALRVLNFYVLAESRDPLKGVGGCDGGAGIERRREVLRRFAPQDDDERQGRLAHATPPQRRRALLK